ncbi:MAG: hypothetical protein KDE58_28870, partial [Caldilineaceae bacterium]|nr:hypothetical protein [Caldilineaceae bacterium]
MNEWLGVIELVGAGVVGLLIGLLITRRRWAKRTETLTESHRAQLQVLHQELTTVRQAHEALSTACNAQEDALAKKDQQLAEQDQEVIDLRQDLATVQEALMKAQADQEQLAQRAQELVTTKEALQSLVERSNGLQRRFDALQEDAAEKTTLAATLQSELNNAQQQAAQLTEQLETIQSNHRAQATTLAALQGQYGAELAFRRHIAQEVNDLYRRLANGNVESEATNQGIEENGKTDHGTMSSNGGPTPVPSPAIEPPANPNGQPAGAEEHKPKPIFAPPNQIERFLSSRGITIKSIPTEEAFDPVLNNLAGFLGSHYEAVRPLYQQIKRNMQQGDDFTLNLKDEPPATISRICQFGKKLHDVAFLEQYRYMRSPHYLLRAKTTRLPTAQNFYSGQWLERYVMQQVEEAITKIRTRANREISFVYLANPQIILPGGQEGELDLIFQVNDTFYWVETKTGDYQQHISKYAA